MSRPLIGRMLLAAGVVAVTISPLQAQTGGGTTRHYYVAAQDVTWDFAPGGRDRIHGSGIPAPWTGHTVWHKVRYVEYTDETFSTPKPQPEWLGVLGPIIRAEVGDTVLVHFCNRSNSGSYGMHPHGFRYTKSNEGAHYFGFDGTPPGAGSEVAPGACFTYRWIADEDSGPGPADPSSLVWWYHSHIDEPEETNAGLLGPIIITRKGMARSSEDPRPRDVDREFITLFMIFDEAEEEEEMGLMHSINGFIFGNLPGLVAYRSETVRWYLLGMGNEVDLHTPHWHGKTVRFNQRRTDVVELLPGSMATVDMSANNVGTWLYHCHVADHIDAGMIATYSIRPSWQRPPTP